MNLNRCLLAVFLAAMSAAPLALADDNDGQKKISWRDTPVVQQVREATRAYRDVEMAKAAGYVDTQNCVSDRDGGGAMGIHFVNPLLLDGEVDLTMPEILVYEPLPNGRLRLVAAEYVAFDDGDPNTGSPILGGQLLNYSGAPNRYGLPAFHELHIWAWQYNPRGVFSDWNPRVTCIHYEGPSGFHVH